MNTPTKEEFMAAIHCLAGYATPYEVTLLADYDRTLGIRDASTEILKNAFAALEAAEADIKELKRHRDFHKDRCNKLESDLGEWVPGLKCSKCNGTGEDEEANGCSACAGTGDVWMTWKERAEAAEADSARLDWLFDPDNSNTSASYFTETEHECGWRNLFTREELDAARKAQP